MWANALKNLILSFNSLVIVTIPVLFELAACLLINLLLNVKLTFVENSDVICEDGDIDLRTFSAVEGWLPSLNEETCNHDIVSRLYQVNQIVLQYHDS